MKLVKFSVTNFRSITAAHKVYVTDTTVLIGRNNEGKSNLLKALSLAMRALQQHAINERRGRVPRRPSYRRDDKSYFWERDFPVALQDRKGQKQSIFKLDFELNDEEINEFKNEVKSNLNGLLPLEIRIGDDNQASIKVAKTGRGAKTLNSKSGRIADFIARRIYFNYIPAVRTDQEALAVISEMLSAELSTLEDDENYKKALKTIGDLQKPILENLAQRIKLPLSEFLPGIKDVNIEITENTRRYAHRRDFQVIIDDGTPTSIEFKGDGVKSLATLGLLKNKISQGNASIIAIEEPESHLHPAAIHQLNKIICSLADDNQIIVSTHNPLFVDREVIKSNIIIDQGKASPAKNIREIRELLGIKASDNLVNANYALVVEGEEDKTSLLALLPTLSNKISKWLKSNLLVIEPIGGAGNLPYKLSLIKNSLCVYHVLLDNDNAGRDAFEKAESEGLSSVKNNTFITCLGMTDSEFEDCINSDIYKNKITEKYGVNLDSPSFRNNSKWSNRMKSVFMDQGKPWNSNLEKEIKSLVANSISDSPKAALNEHKRNSIDSLVKAIENMVKS
ncbi:MAG: AAA family ATPase [Urechidicola sp.]|nr:AAA family ATPase [Urechidicola sp.]